MTTRIVSLTLIAALCLAQAPPPQPPDTAANTIRGGRQEVLLDIIKQKDDRIEVLFLTAQDETSLAVDLMKRGALDFLLKPVELNQLLLSIGRAIEQAHPQFVLQIFNLAGEGRLRHMQLFCTFGKTESLRYSNKVAQVTKLHSGDLSSQA